MPAGMSVVVDAEAPAGVADALPELTVRMLAWIGTLVLLVSLGQISELVWTPQIVALVDVAARVEVEVDRVVHRRLLEERQHPHEATEVLGRSCQAGACTFGPSSPRTAGEAAVGRLVVVGAARASCFRLLTHWARRAASRAACTAGQQQGDEHGDDGDDDQQLDQREAATLSDKRTGLIRVSPQVQKEHERACDNVRRTSSDRPDIEKVRETSIMVTSSWCPGLII